MTNPEPLIKIWFRIAPPEGLEWAESEGLWAAPVDEDTVQIKNVPFHVPGVAYDDVVRIGADQDGVVWAIAPVSSSGRNTITVHPADGDTTAVWAEFKPWGIGGEAGEGTLALDIPSDEHLPEVKAVLTRGTREGRWTYQELCVTERWLAA
ncbi:DUF4265 domain-containing protein [Actinokineospora auranticolor]|uniref:Uncharacterized protein DUF4265 n=1 Tax=Actinokineospora auranticolor TaxID=155976 RepID=A0A2S6GYZ9_9PSEU|nr:DUF4265 domain-containing protein [Actinokineospora auranticolor]PPK70465.1 uncharacterized protein DUF4265 [Actinokineospora auranticolor]